MDTIVRTKKNSCLRNMVPITFISGFFLLVLTYASNNNNTRGFVTLGLINDSAPMLTDRSQFSVVNYTWNCVNNKCERSVYHNNGKQASLETCNMICSETPMLWPRPQKITLKTKAYSTITTDRIVFNFTKTAPITPLLQNVTQRFLHDLNKFNSTHQNDTIRVLIDIYVELENFVKLQLTTKEDYSLKIYKNGDIFVEIQASTYFGVRHSLTTLSQLIWHDKVVNKLRMFTNIEITDSPKFPYRGLMVDTARNYFSINQLRRIIDGMALNKLNVLHLHLTDAESFPIVLPSVRNLANYGAYQTDMIYTSDNIRDLIEYGMINGVRLILEVDAPAHVNAGWNFARDLYNETFVICGEDNVFGGHFNPDNPYVLRYLQLVYRDLLELQSNDEIFHIGGDEVDLTCWQNTKAAQNYNNLYEFWRDYINAMLKHLRLANHGKSPGTTVLWSSPLTDSAQFKSLTGNITVQFWLGNPLNILSNGNSIIYSTVGHWYLDCGYGPWRPNMEHGNCDPYTPWQAVYKYRPWQLYGHQSQTLGGEACLWSEQVGIDDLETRIWPRGAAFAERLWTDPDEFNDYDVFTRFVAQRQRLVSHRIKTAGIWPRWCSQNPGKCGF